jgi:hypothetical protein
MTVSEINILLTEAEKLAGDDPQENREAILDALHQIYLKVKSNPDDYRMFRNQVTDVCGGIYIPYIFWMELREYFRNAANRSVLLEVIRDFTHSSFEEEDRKLLKPLLITYFANEKVFEVDKLQGLVIDLAHPAIQEYFSKITSFVNKNKESTGTYLEKFKILMDEYPDFELLALPVAKLKEVKA